MISWFLIMLCASLLVLLSSPRIPNGLTESQQGYGLRFRRPGFVLGEALAVSLAARETAAGIRNHVTCRQKPPAIPTVSYKSLHQTTFLSPLSVHPQTLSLTPCPPSSTKTFPSSSPRLPGSSRATRTMIGSSRCKRVSFTRCKTERRIADLLSNVGSCAQDAGQGQAGRVEDPARVPERAARSRQGHSRILAIHTRQFSSTFVFPRSSY